MKFERTQVWGFEHALRGMRNSKESWNRSDSHYEPLCHCTECDEHGPAREYTIGKNDMKLAQKLIRAGSEHRKFMRQIFVSVDITAPLYWWKEFDQHKVGTTTNSCSTMHRLADTEITKSCFEMDDFCPEVFDGIFTDKQRNNSIIDALEELRKTYIETKDKRYWKELIRWLPESWLQMRTVTMNYENLYSICRPCQRRFHKLNEWSGTDSPESDNFIKWARSLPYAQDFIFLDEPNC